MSRQRRAGGTEPLPFVVATAPAGPMQQAVAAVLEQARTDGLLAAVDEALAQLAVEAARAVDYAAGDPYAFSQPAAQLRETIALLGLDPKSRGSAGRDPFSAFLDDLADDRPSTPAVDPPQP